MSLQEYIPLPVLSDRIIRRNRMEASAQKDNEWSLENYFRLLYTRYTYTFTTEERERERVRKRRA
jgi:hypothetical protein